MHKSDKKTEKICLCVDHLRELLKIERDSIIFKLPKTVDEEFDKLPAAIFQTGLTLKSWKIIFQG